MRYFTAKRRNKKFVIQNPRVKSRLLCNENNEGICEICMESFESCKIAVMCMNCYKYIGCKDCVNKSLKFDDRCLYCRK